MTSTTEDTRYSRAAIASVITEALVNCDYAHTAEWIRPETCPCHAAMDGEGAGSCLLPPDGQCQGYAQNAALPPGKALTADELIAELPEPDSRGMVSATDAGNALGRLVSTRLSWSPYRKATMFAALGEAMDAYEASLSPGKGTGQQDAGERMPRCGYCGQPVKHKSARYCTPSHRQQAYKRRRRQVMTG